MIPANPGLRGKLLGLLLAFGVLPLLMAISVGYLVSRDTLLRQATDALEALTRAQAVHLATELDRERLLLRTIAGQLPAEDLSRLSADQLALRLVQGLPEGGVFDGLRVVTASGRNLAMVALRNTAPHWPPETPAADWTRERVVVHRDGNRVLAYLLARPLEPAGIWLEGHVRTEDFRRVFSVAEHPMQGVEAAVVDGGGRLVFAAHGHSIPGILALLASQGDEAGTAGRSALLATEPIAGTDWVFVATLPIEAALAPLSRLRDTALGGALILVVLIVLTGALTARTVTTPLRDLATAAEQFGRDGRFHPLPVRTGDEVGIVVESFNTMATSLIRTREQVEALHDRDLERAQQLATVGELASGVAHEIRNPLTGVRGALELAQRSLPGGTEAGALLAEAERQLKRIESTTTQLLSYARPPTLREIVVDVGLVVDRAATIMAPQAAAAGMTLQVESSAMATPVRVDPELIVQVLVNLMLNAIEATTPPGTLTIWTARHAPEVWIGIRDSGPGVPDEIRQDIFRPFYTTKPRGTGLGLSISHQIVDRHGGTLRLEDTPGGGTTFIVALPLLDGAAP